MISKKIQGEIIMSSKLFCRAFQAIMKIGNCFMGYRMPEYIEGSGSISKMPEFLKAKRQAMSLL